MTNPTQKPLTWKRETRTIEPGKRTEGVYTASDIDGSRFEISQNSNDKFWSVQFAIGRAQTLRSYSRTCKTLTDAKALAEDVLALA